MSGAIKGYTPNFKLKKVNFNWVAWHDLEHENWTVVDALLYNVAAINNIQGIWANSLTVIVGDRYIDATDGTIWEVLIGHTTAISPTTFSADRIANPTFWLTITPIVPISKGTWANITVYNKNDYVELNGLVAIAKVSHTSSVLPATIDTDIANWTYLVDIRTEIAQTAADVVSTAADVVSTGADVISTNADAVSTAADVISTNADVLTTNADAIATNADVVATAADVVTTNGDVVTTNADVVQTTANVGVTNGDVISTNADVALTNADVTYAEDWAIEIEDTPVSVAAGGDGATTFSALHWAKKALASAKDFLSGTDTPSTFVGQALKLLRVNTGETAVEFFDLNNINIISKAVNYPIVAADIDDYNTLIVLVDASGADKTITLPALSVYDGKTIEVRTDVDPVGNSVITNKSGGTEFHTGVAKGDFAKVVSDGANDIMRDHYESHYCRVYVNADESVAQGASEQIIGISETTDKGGIWNTTNDEVDVPFDCWVDSAWTILTLAEAAISPTIKIGAVFVRDLAASVSGQWNFGGSAPGVFSHRFSADSGNKIELWATNLDSDSGGANVLGDAAGDESFATIKLTRVY